ncbi:ATP-binding protein [Mucilaginibacter hurinus]|uniref:ATP-binding protein n=1 Tax=Mucilaginibacter hurinus TaxID=2201324 RepID=A0A367GLL6_9SPHI|nr:ATP-binding protein [Mucilaginibacter hurinus]RCH53915.1 ATP-binding protein [Mucilaginibacter hurinus]
MKALTKLLTAAALFAVSTASAQHTVKQVWATDSVLAIPESVYADGKILYVALIDGKPWDHDGKGGIARLSADGKIMNDSWITGLNSPKGMAKHNNTLYVADMDEVVAIDIKKGVVSKKTKISGAEWLNDVTTDTKGIVYVTDSKNGKVFKVEGDNSTLYLDNLKGINGIKYVSGNLYIVTGDGVYKADAAKTVSKLAVLEHGGDGIEPVGNGDFIVSAWQGYMYYVQANGTKTTILDTEKAGKQTADIGYDAKTRTIYVPTFFGKSVVAYRLEK